MRQLVLHGPGVAEIADGPEPGPGPDQALVSLRWAGVCGSDLSAYRGTSPLVRYPRVLGHELLVDVLSAPGRPDLVGRRAVIEPLVPCGRCRACRRGRPNCCADLAVMGVHVDGGLAERFAVATRQLHAVPANLPDDVAVLAEPTSIAYHAVQRSAIEAGQVAVVFGAGTIGLLVASLLGRARGCRVLVVDVDAGRLAVAERLGAVPVPASGDVLGAVREATGGELADVVFEATGNAACTRLTTEVVGHAGRIVLIGWNKGPVEVDTVTLMRKEVDLLGSRNSMDAFPAVLRLLADGAIDAGALITHRFALAEAGAALRLLDGGRGALKVLVAGR